MTTEPKKSADEVEDDVLSKIPTLNVEELEEVCGMIKLTVSNEAKGNRRELRKLLTNELLKDSEDSNLATVLMIHDHLFPPQQPPLQQQPPQQQLPVTPQAAAQGKIKEESLETSREEKDSAVAMRKTPEVTADAFVETRVRECKISGTIGGKTPSKNMTFTRLQFEVNNAKKSKCPPSIIIAGIIKAVDPSNDARTFLETSPEMNLDEVLDFLKNHCTKIDENGTLVTSFQTACQKPNEDAVVFVTRLMVLRKKVMQLSIEKGIPYPEEMLRNEFFHIMFTGLRSESLRSELREMVKGDWLTSDNKLLSYTRKAAENKAERDSKFGESEDKSESSDEVEVNVMSSVCHSKEKKKKENPFVRIEELLMKQDKEIKEMRTEIMELKTGNTSSVNNFPNVNAPTFLPQQQQMSSPSPPQTTSQQQQRIQNLENQLQQMQAFARLRPKRRNECNNCWQTNADKCSHCLKCGKGGHRAADCTEQKNL